MPRCPSALLFSVVAGIFALQAKAQTCGANAQSPIATDRDCSHAVDDHAAYHALATHALPVDNHPRLRERECKEVSDGEERDQAIDNASEGDQQERSEAYPALRASPASSTTSAGTPSGATGCSRALVVSGPR